MATLKDVAREVGVTATTVSNALNDRGSVSPAMKKKIRAAAKKLGYRPNRRAQAMRTGYSRSIGLILPDLTNPFFPELAQSVEQAARERGYTVILFDTRGKQDQECLGFQSLSQHGVDAIIWCPVNDSPPQGLDDLPCPLVVLDRPLSGFDVVQSNYRQGGQLMAEFALENGFKAIGLLSGPANIESARQRREGFLDHLGRAAEVVWEEQVPFSLALSDAARKHLRANQASLIVCGDDLIALAAIEVLQERGLHVPDDVSVIGFDDIPWAKIIRPKLTTIRQPVEAMGADAVELAVQRIDKKCVDEGERDTKTIILNVRLVVRDSVKLADG